MYKHVQHIFKGEIIMKKLPETFKRLSIYLIIILIVTSVYYLFIYLERILSK